MLVVYFQMVSKYCCDVKHIIQSSIVRKPSTAQVDYKQYLFFSIVHCEYERDLRSNEHHFDSSNILLSYTHSHGFIWNQFDQLPIGLLARVVEYCTGIAEVIGSNPIQAWIFFRPYFHYCSSSVHYLEDYFHIHIFIHSSSIWLSCIHSCLSSIVWGKKVSGKSWFQDLGELE